MPSIREAGAGDVEQISLLWEKLMNDPEAADRPFIIGGGARVTWVNWVLRGLEEGTLTTYVAEEDGRIVGYVILLHEKPTVYPLRRRTAVITDLYVEPGWRGRGLGRRLLTRALERAGELGVDAVEVSTWVYNRRALRLYTRAGFKPYFLKLRKNLA